MFEEILQKIKPKKEEEEKIQKIINEFKNKIQKIIDNYYKDIEIFIGGSFAKGTWLSKDTDIDVFIRFDKKYEEKKLSEIIEDILKKSGFKYTRVKASRDYFEVHLEGYKFEIVPVIKIEDPNEAKNTMDLSPFHVEWVRKKLKERPELRDEILIAKYFLKVNKIYGAESYVRGLSGYATEVLVIHYGSFLNFIEGASKWKPKTIIDPENYYKNPEEVFKSINPDKLKSPLIIIDPVFSKRNIAASLSMEKFSKLVVISKLFLKDLKEKNYLKWFEQKKIDLKKEAEEAKKNNLSILYLEVVGNHVNKDIANTKVLKFFEFLINSLKRYGFKVFRKEIEFEEPVKIYVWVYPRSLPKIEIHYGPYPWLEINFKRFIDKWKDKEIFIEKNGKPYVLIERKIKNLEDAIKEILKNSAEISKNKVKVINYKILS